MGKFDLFRKLNTINGNTSKQIITNNLEKEFDQYMKSAPNTYNIMRYNDILNVEIPCTLQDASFNDKKNGDEKIVCCYNESDLVEGDVITVDGKIWIVMFEESNTIKSHKTFMVRPCDNNGLKFQVNSTIYTIPAIISNQTLYTVGINEGKYMTTGDTKMSCILGVNDMNKDIVKYIFRGMRFVFDSNGAKLIYKITYIDTVTNEGLLTCTLQEEGDMGDNDDLVNMVAYNPSLIDEIVVPSVENYQIVSSTNNYDYINLSSVRTWKIVNSDGTDVSNNDTFVFRLEQSVLNSNILPSALISNMEVLTGVSVKLMANGSNVKGYVNLVATCNRDGSIYRKSIRIKGLTDL